MNLDKKVKIDKIVYGILNLAILLYGASLVYLFWKQTQWTDGSVFESDLPAHISMVIDDGWYYSLTALAYKLIYAITGLITGSGAGRSLLGDGAVALFLALASVASIYMTTALLKQMAAMNHLQVGLLGVQSQKVSPHLLAEETKVSESLYLFLGFALNLVMACYIPGLADGRYIGMQSGSIWHNSTYIVMKCFAIGSLMLYLRLEDHYAQHLTGKEWFTFTLLLAVTTGIKPSFLFAFAPVMAIFLLVDLLQGVPFGKIVLFGCTVLPSLGVILLQNAILFGSNTGNSIAIMPGYAISIHSGHPIIAAALSVLFPLLVLVWNWKALGTEKWYRLCWSIALVGFLELFLFTETGNRAGDGNFMWGYSMAVLFIFGVSALKWLQNLRGLWNTNAPKSPFKEPRKQGFPEHGLSGNGKSSLGMKRKWLLGVYLLVTAAVFLYHLYCGLYFYSHLLQGVSYWMWG